MGHLGDSQDNAFHKDSELVQHIRQTYFRTHALTFHKEDTNELTEVFKELAEIGRSPRHQSLPCSRPVGGQGGTLLCLLCSKRICQRPPLFQDSGAHLKSLKIMGL